MGTINYRDPSLLANIITNGTMSVSDKEQLNIVNNEIQSIKIALDGYGTGTAGESALLDGYALITLPEGIPPDAIIMFSRKTSLGTIGDISIASQNTNEFSLVSSSSLDQSTVSWSINRVVTGSLVIGNTTGTAADGGLLQTEIDRSITTDQEIKNVLDGYVPMAWFVANWSITDWYVDAVSGNDNNLGTYPELPLRTVEELSRRLAVSVPFSHIITVHIAQGTYGMLSVKLNQSSNTAKFSVSGQSTAVGSLVVGTYTVWSHLTATGCLLSVPGMDFSELVGYRLRRLSDSSVAWILLSNPDELGISVCQITQPFSLIDLSEKSWSPSDSLEIEFLPQIASASIQSTPKKSQSHIPVALSDLHIITQLSVNFGECSIYGCRISGKINTWLDYISYWYGSLFTFTEYSNKFDGIVRNCGIYPGVNYPESVNIGFSLRSGSMVNCTILRTRLTISANTDPVNLYDCQFFGLAENEVIGLSYGSHLRLYGGISGKGCSAGIRARRGGNAQLQYMNGLVFNLETVLDVILLVYKDFNVGGSGDSGVVWNYMKEWRDGGQSGTAVIGSEGFVDVVLPTIWVPSFQRLMLSAYTTAGLGSVVSAPFSLRTSAGFKILGTPGDIVDWYIPAIGYGNFISEIAS